MTPVSHIAPRDRSSYRRRRNLFSAPLPLVLLALLGCAGPPAASGRWQGTIDTLPSGTVAVTNPAQGLWDSASSWTVTEELRIGTLEGSGPDLFGEITALEVDRAGRVWVLEGQAEELRVFDRDGRYVRTVGRKGNGPGEFAQPIGMAWGPDGNLWVIDPQNNRISEADTTGTFVTSHYMLGGFMVMPWPGGFDSTGVLYNYAPHREGTEFRFVLVRYDTALNPIDTVGTPRYTGAEDYFELRTARGGRMRTSVPYSPSLEWRLTRAGDFWAALTGPYELLRLARNGDTLRSVKMVLDPIRVTEEEVDSAIAGLKWFTSQGGKVDRSRIPSTKPALSAFYVADDGHLWVQLTTRDRQDRGHLFDVLDPQGRYLGRVRLPFRLSEYPTPVFRHGMIYGVTQDELEVPFVVRARIRKGADGERRSD